MRCYFGAITAGPVALTGEDLPAIMCGECVLPGNPNNLPPALPHPAQAVSLLGITTSQAQGDVAPT